MKRTALSFAFALLCIIAAAQTNNIGYTVSKIWDNGMHCAFTSLIKYKDMYVCSFREGETHVFNKDGKADGKVRILLSRDGSTWEPLELISKEGLDLRDPKLSVMPDGRLMVSTGGSLYRGNELVSITPHVMFSNDGRHFSDPIPVQLPEVVGKRGWLWRVTWHDNTGYGVVYSNDGKAESQIHLVKTTDGIHYSLVTSVAIDGFPNESTVRFLPNGRMAMMVRRDQGDCLGLWGTAQAPYTQWEWKKMEFRVGGPDFIVLNDGTVIAGSRNLYIPSQPTTTLFTGDTSGRFREKLVLPSGGDTSYPGFIVEDNELWVSYYSSHETKNASVYLAKIPLEMLK